MWLVAVPLGLLVGISLGALGGGGSILTVPALVYALGESASRATTASLVIVGIAAISGAAGHARAGRVRWIPGTVFGAVGVGGSLVGSYFNRAVNPDVLLLAFAGLMIVAAGAMLRRTSSPPPAATGSEHRMLSMGRVLSVAAAGTLVGFMTGFFGVGGGFVVVPALVVALGFGMAEAVGTSVLIITINTIAALAARGVASGIDWSIVVPFAVAAVGGSLAGNRIAERVPSSTLTRAFAALLVLLAAYGSIRSALALT